MIKDGQAPIDLLDQEFDSFQKDFAARSSQAQQEVQELNKSVDKLDDVNRVINRFVQAPFVPGLRLIIKDNHSQLRT